MEQLPFTMAIPLKELTFATLRFSIEEKILRWSRVS
jgi:hypothetical protein